MTVRAVARPTTRRRPLSLPGLCGALRYLGGESRDRLACQEDGLYQCLNLQADTSSARVVGVIPERTCGVAGPDIVHRTLICIYMERLVQQTWRLCGRAPDIVKAAMRRLKLTVAINTKLNRGHVVHGQEALILPCLARSDIDMQATGRQSVTVEDSMSMVHASGGLVQPPSRHLKSEVSIVCGMARTTLPDSGIDWNAFEADYNLIRDKIAAVFPKLFADFNTRVRTPGGFHLYNGPQRREWKTATGRANFLVWAGVAEDPDVDEPAALQLTTIRSHDQYNTTIYSLDDRYRGVFGGRMVVFMNKDDMAERRIEANSFVQLESVMDHGDVRRTAEGFKVKPYNIPRGSIAAYYPETNNLMPLSYHDQRSKTPSAKSIPVLVRPMRDAAVQTDSAGDSSGGGSRSRR
jgi:anaerobic selenocysteine-containing dehydrogenase